MQTATAPAAQTDTLAARIADAFMVRIADAAQVAGPNPNNAQVRAEMDRRWAPQS